MKHSEFRYLMLKVFFNNISTIYKRNYFESFPGEELAIKLKFTKKKRKKNLQPSLRHVSKFLEEF